MTANSFFDPRPFDLAAEIVHDIAERDPARRRHKRHCADLDLLLVAAECERDYDGTRKDPDVASFWADLARSDRLRHLRHIPQRALIDPVCRVLRGDDQLAVAALRALGGEDALTRVHRLAWGLALADSQIAGASR